MAYKNSNERDYFGDCPECGCNDGYLNIYKANWMVCHEHKKRWLVGEDLFSSWRFETEKDWEENFERIKDYEEVEPLLPELTEEDRRHIEAEKDAMNKHSGIDNDTEVPF